MRNRAYKYAVRWCHLTHQVIAGASVHSREPKARVAEVYSYFVSKIFINHIVINMSCQTCPAHIVKCHNAKTAITVTLLTIIFEPSTAAIDERHTRFKFRHHHDTSPNKIKYFVLFLILWMFDFSVPLLLFAFASSSCLFSKLFQSICVTMHVVMT